MPSRTEAFFTQQAIFIFNPVAGSADQLLISDMNSLIRPSEVVSTAAQKALEGASKAFTRIVNGMPGITFTASVSSPTLPVASVITHGEGISLTVVGCTRSKCMMVPVVSVVA